LLVQGDQRRGIALAVAKLDRMLRLGTLVNFVVFLLTGRYCTLAERAAGMRMVRVGGGMHWDAGLGGVEARVC
jgi:hypothetical protein